MDSKSFLMSQDAESGPEAEEVKLDYLDFQRSIVLFSNFRSGSHMLKLSLGKLGRMVAPAEPFNHQATLESGYTLRTYLENDGPMPKVMSEGHFQTQKFMANFYENMPRKRSIILDVKYSQAYSFGVNAEMNYPVPVPVILEEFIKLKMPVVHLTRRDLVAQAISLMVAENSDEWLLTSSAEPQNAPNALLRLPASEVLKRARQARNARVNADVVLSALDARVHNVEYEDLISGVWRTRYRGIFRFLDQYADIPEDFSPPSKRQNSMSRVTNLAEIRAYVDERDPNLNG